MLNLKQFYGTMYGAIKTVFCLTAVIFNAKQF